MIYLNPPTVDEPKWKLQSIQPDLNGKKSSYTHTFNLAEKIAKVLAERGVPVILPGQEPVGVTEGALTDALDALDDLHLTIGNRLNRTLMFEAKMLAGVVEMPQVWWDCEHAMKAKVEAENRYEEAHEKLMEYAMDQLGLNELTCILVEGVHECVKSPTRRCLYDDEEDPSHDDCLVCGKPEERK